MSAQRLKMLLAAVVAMVLILGVGVAYANSTQNTGTKAGDDNGARAAGHEDSDGPGDDADEPGDHDGPGDTED